MRCPRCGFEAPEGAQSCSRCGYSLAQANQQNQQNRQVPPAWTQRPPTASPPWSGAQDAAPWQTPPQATRNVWPTSTTAETQAPPPPSGKINAALTLTLVGAFVVLALTALVYAGYAIISRRAIFGDLATNPAAVTPEEAASSDRLNLVLFLIAGLVLVATACVLVAWVVQATRVLRRGPFPTGWWALAGGGIVVVVAALAVHTSPAPATIAVGYLILGAGALAEAGAAIWGALIAFRASKTKQPQPQPQPQTGPPVLPPFNPRGPVAPR